MVPGPGTAPVGRISCATPLLSVVDDGARSGEIGGGGSFADMADITIYHDPNCSSSRAATDAADELGIGVDIRRYKLKAERPTVEELRDLVAILEDEPTALVRRDANFTKLGLSDADVETPEQVAEVLAAHPEMIQRPVLITDGAAIIGRPKDRVVPFLTAHS